MIRVDDVIGNCSLKTIAGNDGYIRQSFYKVKRDFQEALNNTYTTYRVLLFTNYSIFDQFKYRRNLRRLGFRKVGSYTNSSNKKVYMLVANVKTIMNK